MKIEPFIETVTGRRFYALNADPGFDINEIAEGLSKACRYAGQCRGFYSVAEHSVLVATIMETWRMGDPFEGLMHDGTESILCDVAGPWKRHLADYKTLEDEVDAKLRTHWGLPPEKTPGCDEADKIALMVEGRTLLPSKGELMIAGGIPAHYGELADQWIACHGPSIQGLEWPEARTLFLNRYKELRP